MTDLKFKAGDHVMVPARVTGITDNPPTGYFLGFSSGREVWLPEIFLASATLIERPLAVGDRVACRSKSILMTIKAIDGEMAWVEALGDHWTVNLSELRRAEERG